MQNSPSTESFRLRSEPYDIVITDMNMPDVGGYAVGQGIKAESPNTPVILISGAGNTTKNDGSLSGCVDIVLHKPIRMQELNDVLQRTARPA